MAVCDECRREMTDPETKSCVGAHIRYADMQVLEPVPYSGPGRCHDCGVASGGWHHPGCDVERCPRCGGQLITCPCEFEEGEDEEGP